MQTLLLPGIASLVLSVGATAVQASDPPKLTCSAKDTKRSAVVKSEERSSGGTAKYVRYCGPARVSFRLGGNAYVVRGGSCYRDLQQGGFDVGYISFAGGRSYFPGVGMWWAPPATRPGQRVKVHESTIQLPGFSEYAGDGTVVIGSNGGTFTLVGRSSIRRWSGKRVTGSFFCR